ncbi:AAA family ATPase [Limnochorda pilosa]|uniref:ATPase n=1 Tax=Limnochorda pilosa TaxID=1555112 RepID=A0A0K2SIZ1_LIMPI|nr:MoxR family ATPase [Limnochorda pilosa]BAS26997.1 ATPase [Limnochorda pilosa]
MPTENPFGSIEALEAAVEQAGYVPDRALSTVLYLALALEHPLFLEGEPGVGKTEVAKVLAQATGRPLERLQCYEGLDVAHALYEWDYPRQLLEIRLAEASGPVDRPAVNRQVFSPAFLIRRPLLRAIDPEGPAPVLLIDEIDRSDEEFEAFLLELLSDFQVTIPELGTLRARERPVVVITSNRTREIHDALKRRCLYHWIDYPDAERERQILLRKVPGVTEGLARQAVAFVQRLRQMDLYKLPGVAETINWAAALQALGQRELDPGTVEASLGVLLKYRDDLQGLDREQVRQILAEVG